MRKQMAIGWMVLLAGCGGAQTQSANLKTLNGGALSDGTGVSAGGLASGSPSTAGAGLKSFVDHPDMSGKIPDGLELRAYWSWEELLAAEKPDLVLRPPGYKDGHDLLWVERGPKGELGFRLDRAFLWKPREGAPMWLMFRVPPEVQRWWEIDLETELTDAHIPITAARPTDDHYLSYAWPIATDPDAGTVYEIGWNDSAGRGSAVWEGERILYVWQHADGTWQFVGEGEEVFHGHTGGASYLIVTLASSARFVKETGLPRIVLEFQHNSCESGETEAGVADITQERDYVLSPGAGGEPGVPQLTGEKRYTQAVEGDTLDRVAERVAMRGMEDTAEVSPSWHQAEKDRPLTAAETAENAELVRQAKAMLLRLNPELAVRPVKAWEKLTISREMEGG